MSTLSFFERFVKMSSFDNLANSLTETIETTVATYLSNVDLSDFISFEGLVEMVSETDQIHDSICSTVSAYLTEDTEAIDTIISDYLSGSDYIQADDLEDLVRDEDIGSLVEHELSYRIEDMVSEDVLEDAVKTVKDEILERLEEKLSMVRDVNVAHANEIERLESLLEKERQSRLEDMETLKEMMVQLTLPKPSIFSKLSSFSLPTPRWFKWFK